MFYYEIDAVPIPWTVEASLGLGSAIRRAGDKVEGDGLSRG